MVVKANRNPIPSVQEGPELWKELHHSQGNLEAISAQIDNLLGSARRQKDEMDRCVDMMHAQQAMMQQFKSTVSANWSSAGTAGGAAEGVYQDGRVLSDAEVCTEATFAGAAQLLSKLGAKLENDLRPMQEFVMYVLHSFVCALLLLILFFCLLILFFCRLLE